MITIIPDIHGRVFWKKAVDSASKDDTIVFLGDYLDMYWVDSIVHDITNESTLENFREILEFKKSNPERVVLLLGNHDCEYMYSRNVCDCRCDRNNYDTIQSLFRENWKLFRMAWDATIRGIRYVFSHAGLSIEWMNEHVKGWDEYNLVERLNALYEESMSLSNPESSSFAEALSEMDIYRCGEGSLGSPIWQDAENAARGDKMSGIMQVVGHTKCKDLYPIRMSGYWFLDCDGGQWFTLTDHGGLRDKDGSVVRKNENPFNPPGKEIIDTNCFGHYFCRNCGSERIYIRAGMYVDTYVCLDCGTKIHA